MKYETEQFIEKVDSPIMARKKVVKEVLEEQAEWLAKLPIPHSWDVIRVTTRGGYYENLMSKAIDARKIAA